MLSPKEKNENDDELVEIKTNEYNIDKELGTLSKEIAKLNIDINRLSFVDDEEIRLIETRIEKNTLKIQEIRIQCQKQRSKNHKKISRSFKKK